MSQSHAGIGTQIQDKAKKSAAVLSNLGATLRTHLENPFVYKRENDTSPALPARQPTATLHPSLVRGQVAPADPPRRTTKPLPPIPQTAAFPPEIPVGSPGSANLWDDFNDKTDTLKPGNPARPKSATITSTTPASNPSGTTPSILHHTNSSSNILAANPLSPNTNVFEFSPFELDITPATPAPSISNTASRPPAWFSPGSVSGNQQAEQAANPFYAPSLPPVSLKPLNPFDNHPPATLTTGSDPIPVHSEPNNIFTSFSLDALAPPDNAHTAGLATSFGTTSSFSKGSQPAYASSAGDYFSPGSVTGFGSPTSSNTGGTVPNMPNVPSGGTVPNLVNAPSGGTVPNMQNVQSGGTVPNMTNVPSGGTIPNMPMSNVSSGGAALNNSGGVALNASGSIPPPSYNNVGVAQPIYGSNGVAIGGDSFDNFLAARTSSPSIPAILVSTPAPTPTPVSVSNPGQGSADEFDSFLAARISQM